MHIETEYVKGKIVDGNGKFDISLTPKETYGRDWTKPHDGNNVWCVMFGHNEVGKKCRDCEYACKYGVLNDVNVDYCRYTGRGCHDCGLKIKEFFHYGTPCPSCGSTNTGAFFDGKPHVHGRGYGYELHIDPDVEDSPVTRTLCAFLGIKYDFPVDVEGYSCLGSWVNLRPDSSGFDLSTVRDLNNAIKTRISKNLLGDKLFMVAYPKEGKAYSIYGGRGKGKVVRYWRNGEYRPVSEWLNRKNR